MKITLLNFRNERKPKDAVSYEAVNEFPRVFCAMGDTPSDALEAMAEILRENNVPFWTASSVHFDIDTDDYYITIYV